MKKIVRIMMIALLGFVVLSLAACGGDGTYSDMDEKGYTVSVRFDVNGGKLASLDNIYVVDVFNPSDFTVSSDGTVEIPLLAPDDARRGDGQYSVTRSNYTFAGWFTQRTERKDENGNLLDEYGEIITDPEAQTQGYIYSGKWNFDTDTVSIAADGEYSSEECVLTLYAAWIPYFHYEFYAENADGEYELISTVLANRLELPAWNESTGKLNMQKFPARSGMTFDGAYFDPERTEPVTDALVGDADYEAGIASTKTVKIYTDWLVGDWYRIYTEKQFFSNFKSDGCYLLCADLDFTNAQWPSALATGSFYGTIDGNGHRISGISLTQSNARQQTGGVFGALAAGAVIKNVSFENVTYTVKTGSLIFGATVGLFAGTISETAVLEDVSVSGTLVIDASLSSDVLPALGLISAHGAYGLDFSDISCRLSEESDTITTAVDENSGVVTVTFANAAD